MFNDSGPLNLPATEEKVLAFWHAHGIFEQSLAQRKGKKIFVFYEGPPYANGKPGIHHVLARVFKDVILRHRAMRGYYVPRRAGWDTHGLPVEIAAEKALGITSKKEIEKLGVATFNQKAREAVWLYKDEWEKLTERSGFWLDLKNPYITYEPPYIESLWWVLKEIAKRGLLHKHFKVVPFCPRCQTPLASHELAQPGVYRNVSDPSLYVKFKLKGRKNEYFLVWTTTPWTLPANIAIAVHPKLLYYKYCVGKEFLWSHISPPDAGGNAEVVETVSGKELSGFVYEPLYPSSTPKKRGGDAGWYRVHEASFVGAAEGTGFVHIAPAFGVDDFALAEKAGIREFPMTVGDDGKMLPPFPGKGRFVKDADEYVVQDLTRRGFLHSMGKVAHEYPFCWRCSAPLLYMARSSWFIEMSRLRKELCAENENINWIPRYLKDGRFGEWIKEARDWALSRNRYWGTPLPIWECSACDHHHVVGGLGELDRLAYEPNTFFAVRHTEADHIVRGILAGGKETARNASHLTEKGRRDAERIAKDLKKKKIDLIYTSPFARTREMARIIRKATGARVVVDTRLREMDMGVFNGKKEKERERFFKTPLEEFTKVPKGAEPYAAVQERMRSLVTALQEKHWGKRIALVSHGGPLWLLEAALQGASPEAALRMDLIGVGEMRVLPAHNWPYAESGELDLHRPFVDRIALRCAKCGGKMARIPDVADVWFDSGAMPFASLHYPFAHKAAIDAGTFYPADFIAEGIDQTRGWFYTLLAVAVALRKGTPYRNVISLGLILDKEGQKMSKSKGNIVDPWSVFAAHGADATRWYFYTMNDPAEPKRFDDGELAKSSRSFLSLLYNSFLFYKTYGRRHGAGRGIPSVAHVLDRWVIARLHETMGAVSRELDRYEVGPAAKALEEFVGDLSRWYIRRSRRRFQRPSSSRDVAAASAVLGYVLLETTKLAAPFVPFFAEALYASLCIKNPKLPPRISVHLEDMPKAEKRVVAAPLLREMARVRQVASMALAKRAEAGIKVRQPLAALTLKVSSRGELSAACAELLRDEVNVKHLRYARIAREEVALDTNLTPALREEGMLRELIRIVQDLRQEAGLHPTDTITLSIVTEEPLTGIVGRHASALAKEVGARHVAMKRDAKARAGKEAVLDGMPFWIGIRA